MRSERKIQLFDEVFFYVEPHFVRQLGGLLILSIAATVSEGDFATNIQQRLQWVDYCLGAIDATVSRRDFLTVPLHLSHIHSKSFAHVSEPQSLNANLLT